VRKLLALVFSAALLAISIVALLSVTRFTTTPANAAPNPIDIISISELSSTSVEILFNSTVPKKSLSYYVINVAADLPAMEQQNSKTQNVASIAPKNFKKVIKIKATGLITAEIKNLNPGTAYKFSVSAKTNKAKMISSEVVEYSSLSNLMDALSNLPADWGNPKPIQIPVAAPAPAPVILSAPAFTLTSSTESRTVNTTATGFTISSTGGAIASFAINATPPGMNFNTTTGALTGTPNTVAAATTYTITATNASGSATQSFGLTVTAVVYTVGQAGPGGGIIFYVASTPFACGPTRAANCTYLEAAPSGWNGGAEDPTRSWAQATPVDYQSTTVPGNGATATAIGWGYRNTRAIIAQGNTNTATSAAALTDSHTVTVSGVVYDDWFLPSKDELNQMCKWVRGVAWTSDATVCTGGTLNSGTGAAGFEGRVYWTSSEIAFASTWGHNFFHGSQSSFSKFGELYIRPVRAF